MFNTFFPKIVTFMRKCGKIWYSRISHRRQYTRVGTLILATIYLQLIQN